MDGKAEQALESARTALYLTGQVIESADGTDWGSEAEAASEALAALVAAMEVAA